jgi:hypothetical protein
MRRSNLLALKSRLALLAGFALFLGTIGFSTMVFAQSPETEPGAKIVPVPTITFELNWREADPNWYSVTVEADGPAAYRSQPKVGPNEIPGDPYMVKFTATEATRKRMFALAAAVKFFQGNFEYRGGNIAKTGTKTLRYQYGKETNETSFNFSTNTDLMDLVTMFQQISTTIEFGRRIDFKLRFDKLGLDSELKALESAYSRGALLEVQAIAPILQKVLNDRGTMNISRARIQHILGQNGGKK